MKNKALIAIARASGSPKEHGAGLIVHRKRGDRVAPGEVKPNRSTAWIKPSR